MSLKEILKTTCLLIILPIFILVMFLLVLLFGYPEIDDDLRRD
jgi:hypothetical protein